LTHTVYGLWHMLLGSAYPELKQVRRFLFCTVS